MGWERIIFATAVFLGVFVIVTASADELVSTTTLNVRAGPGTDFSITAQLHQNEIVTELRCNNVGNWCEVRLKTGSLQGWVARKYLRLTSALQSTEPAPQMPVVTPRPAYSLPPEPLVCFYDRANFEGREMCSGIGDRYPSLHPLWDNEIHSVRVEGGLAVIVCTGRNLTGMCAMLDLPVADLGDFAGAILSYSVEGRP